MEVTIVNYEKKYSSLYKELNYEWIKKYFKVEQADIAALENHQDKILTPGGVILFAKVDQNLVGTCALIPMESNTFELAKMAIAPIAQGKGIGSKLAKAIIEKAKELGAERIYLESNTVLEAAVHLYKKLGFKVIHDMPTPYDRCNIQMMLHLK